MINKCNFEEEYILKNAMDSDLLSNEAISIVCAKMKHVYVVL